MGKDNGKSLVLQDVHGIGDEFTLLDGVDDKGNVWIYYQRHGKHDCLVCGKAVTDGWLCFDDGNAVCNEHVTISGKMG